MKIAALIVMVTCGCFAQSPMTTASGVGWFHQSTGTPDYTATLYVDLETDPTFVGGISAGGYANGTVVTWWTNIAPLNPSLANSVYSPTTTSAVWPKYNTANTTPTGKPCVDFSANNGSSGTAIPKITASGSNQPNTVIMVVDMTFGGSASVIDCWTGSRTLIRHYADVSDDYLFFSGASFNIGNGDDRFIPNAQWYILTVVFNGANSYARTNGVAIGTGNPSTAGFGSIQLGNDGTFVTPWKSRMAALRIYQEALGTNNLHTAEQNLATRYFGITLPSP